jgi:RNA polymerase sigma factor (sigma-70 family)
MSPHEAALVAAVPAAGARPAVAIPAAKPARPAPDQSALINDLHGQYGPELLRFCRWMLKDAEDAADAMQDTWIRAMTALGDDRVRVATLRPWLYAIARNACLDRLREHKRRSLHDLDADAAGEAPSVDQVVALRQEAAAALALVGSLSERQRRALLMREVAGMSVPDIADALGLTPERTAWTITDARRALTEARSGSTIECADVRARLGAGRRGRSVRTHLQECGPCRAHDAKLSAGRVLAPALLPLFWLRRLSWPGLLKPATASVLAGVAAAGLPVVNAGRATPAAPAPTPITAAATVQLAAPTPSGTKPRHPVSQARHEIRARVTATKRTMSNPTILHPQRSPALESRPAHAVAAPAPAAAKPDPVHRTVDSVRRITAAAPVVGPVVDTAVAAVSDVVDAAIRQDALGL